MQLSLLFTAADIEGIQRFNQDSVSDQILMELLVSDLTVPKKRLKAFQTYFKDIQGDYRDVCTWKGVKCDADERVNAIRFEWKLLGTLNFQNVPPMVESLIFVNSDFDGSVDTSELPSGLKKLMLSVTTLSGTFAMESLPNSLTEMNIPQNKFSGSCNLTSLPSGMQSLRARANCFTGSFTLQHLPASLEFLDLSENQLTGSLCIDGLPPNMQALNVSLNQLSGELRVIAVPESLKTLRVYRNALSGTAVVGAAVFSRCNAEADEPLFFDASGTAITAVAGTDGALYANPQAILYE